MSLKSYAGCIVFITLFSLMHVTQHVAMIECSYKIKESENGLEHLLDRNAFLVYNIAALESPASLTNRLPEAEYAFAVPEEIVLADISGHGRNGATIAIAERHNGILNKLRSAFALRTEAHATEK